MRILYYYPNLTQGGMGTVLRSRARNSPSSEFNLLFSHDKGGGKIFRTLPNVDYRLVRPDRLQSYLIYLVNRRSYDEVAFTSSPELANYLFADLSNAQRVYEFHSSDVRVLTNEIGMLDFRRIDEIRVPSVYLADVVTSLLPATARHLVVVTPNEVDETIFYRDDNNVLPTEQTTLVWVGQFSKAKGYNDFVRVLGKLPNEFHAEMYFSGSFNRSDIVDLMAEIARNRAEDLISIFYNVPQEELAHRYRSLGKSGIFVSTSLMESFGYGVYEALKCGMNCVAYSLPALRSFETSFSRQLRFVPLGEIAEMTEAILFQASGLAR